MGVMHTLGTGQVEYTVNRPIIHFGSPDGTVYSTDATVVKSNISVKEWLERNG